MISKNLYSNLLKEDMKRRFWTLALAMLAFVMGLPIYAMLRLDRMKASIETAGIEEAQKYFSSIANKDGLGVLLVITIAGAIICGISGFSYLYSKSKVDLYHSIPVKREKLFLVTYMNGIIIYVVPYLINLVIYFIVGVANGLLTRSTVSGAFSLFFINLIGYLLVYSITIVAVMLTGNWIVGLFGTAVFMMYGSVIIMIRNVICELFFKTYYQDNNAQEQLHLIYVSPIDAYNYLVNRVGKSGYIIFFIGIIIVIVIATGIGIILYKIRPSESAGKSMAFRNTQAIIKFLIVVPTSVVGGLLFISMSDTTSFAWMLFGIVFVGFLAHGIIEIIYNNDFKCIITNKLQLVICLIASLVIAGAVKLDWFQYDSYIPNENKIDSMSISFSNIEPDMEYYEINYEYDTSSYNHFNYLSREEYRLSRMELTKFESAYQLVEYAKENNISGEEYIQDDTTNSYTTFTVKYTLKNKKEKYRYYTVKLSDIMKYVDLIYADESYKEGVYQILTTDRSIINSMSYYNGAENDIDDLKLTEEQKQEFLDTFTKELKSITGTEIVESIPVTMLTFQINDGWNTTTQRYYVYPQFTETIAYLKTLGANLDSINPDIIESITIIDYNFEVDKNELLTEQEEKVTTDKEIDSGDYTKKEKEYTYTDSEQIAEICKAIIPSTLAAGTRTNTSVQSNLEVSIIYKYVGYDDAGGSIIIDKLPENIRQQIGY